MSDISRDRHQRLTPVQSFLCTADMLRTKNTVDPERMTKAQSEAEEAARFRDDENA